MLVERTGVATFSLHTRPSLPESTWRSLRTPFTYLQTDPLIQRTSFFYEFGKFIRWKKVYAERYDHFTASPRLLPMWYRFAALMTNFFMLQSHPVFHLHLCSIKLNFHIMKVGCWRLIVRGTQRQFSGKYLLGRRFEMDFRSICCKISCLPASPRIFEHLQNGIITHF